MLFFHNKENEIVSSTARGWGYVRQLFFYGSDDFKDEGDLSQGGTNGGRGEGANGLKLHQGEGKCFDWNQGVRTCLWAANDNEKYRRRTSEEVVEGVINKTGRGDEGKEDNLPVGRNYEFIPEDIDWACNRVMARIRDGVTILVLQ
ncbi:unnamed protein product [Vicia faba]|uniref:Uncharacterized protein n=1 Tax=Vicia faba TaxID=3906 RepID=A0AAV0ZQ47_VICFA|nr:unnamed protein product [Vicia faba]